MEKFTIIIPTHNRPKYLRRILDYYSGYKSGYNLIVADSSSEENKKKNKEAISLPSDLKILHLGNYHSGVSLWHKLADAIGRVETKYCLFCADDDFIVPSGVEKSVDFLEKNSGFSVAQGQEAIFYPMIKKGGDENFYWRVEYPFKSDVLPDARSRLIEQLTNYSVPTFYGVHRTEDLKMIFEDALGSVTHGRLIEVLLAALILVRGKMECFGTFYSAREIILDSAGIMNDRIEDLIKRGEYGKEYVGFRKCLASHLKNNSDLNLEESAKVVDEAMSVFLKNDGPGPRKKLLMDILKSLPAPVSRKIQLIYRTAKLKILKPESDLLRSIKDPLSGSYGDFIRIRDCVASHKDIYEK